jgi:hypothetical protein
MRLYRIGKLSFSLSAEVRISKEFSLRTITLTIDNHYKGEDPQLKVIGIDFDVTLADMSDFIVGSLDFAFELSNIRTKSGIKKGFFQVKRAIGYLGSQRNPR